MNQTAFDFRASDPSTSRRAAADNFPHRGTDRWLALETFTHWADLTDFELADLTFKQQTSIGKRRKELERLGFIEWAGTERPAPSGSMARVWRLTAEGFAYWQANR